MVRSRGGERKREDEEDEEDGKPEKLSARIKSRELRKGTNGSMDE